MGLAAFNRMRRLNAEKEKEKEKNDFSKLKVEELKAKLAELGVEIPDGANKAELVALLTQTTA
ncbi:HeH/LEM domain-containing protein [Actinobacillus porcinus]|uniref:HeH/LEM domain-containing protein n=1 Tax=Actinobacillus porcinus TaxID=51048 RepID=UPI002357B9A0|nr:HeH/LEM domain-containing protein [Actinobacillus porcinus]MDD7545579.1 HeH/LEM domain-containing protein [Actinobacillus porcinus]MDY5847628.1 HeH/LEM domain-containing protein [Actinobacillus porcinus]